MAEFDPQAYINANTASTSGFDPQAYIASADSGKLSTLPTVPASYNPTKAEKVVDKYVGWNVLEEVDGFPTTTFVNPDGDVVPDADVPKELMDEYKAFNKLNKGKKQAGNFFDYVVLDRTKSGEQLSINQKVMSYRVSEEDKKVMYQKNKARIEKYKALDIILQRENAAAEIEKNRIIKSLKVKKEEIKQIPYGYGSQMVDPNAGEGGGNIIGNLQENKLNLVKGEFITNEELALKKQRKKEKENVAEKTQT